MINSYLRLKLLLLGLVAISFTVISQDIESELVAKYYFNFGSIIDESGNGLHGDFNSAEPAEDRFGNENSAYYFDGSEYINVPFIDELSLETITVSLWFKSTSTDYSRLINLPYGGAPSWSLSYYSEYSPTGMCFYAGYDEPGPWTPGWAGTSDLSPAGEWHFVAGVRDSLSKKIYFYLDCELIDSSSYEGHPYEPNESMNIGRYNAEYGQYFEGAIDDIRIYSRALSEEDLGALCSEGQETRLGIDGSGEEEQIITYPNPVEDWLFIDCDSFDTKIGEIRLLSSDGEILHSTQNVNEPINFIHYNSGLYFICITDLKGKIISRHKLIKG